MSIRENGLLQLLLIDAACAGAVLALWYFVFLAYNRRKGAVALHWVQSACAGKGRTDVAVSPAKVEEIQMEPIKLQAVKGPDGVQRVESFDATELFEGGGAALSEKRYDDAISSYERLLKEFPAETKYTKAALYNQGLAYQGKKDWTTAIAK